MTHGRVRKGWRVVSASIPEHLAEQIDRLQESLGHGCRSETIRMIFQRFFLGVK